MKIHHLNCATMCPVGYADGSYKHLVCHCLLVETDSDGLVLIDTGLGLDDVARDTPIPLSSKYTLRPALNTRETAVRQVERLGYAREDVRHIILTHLDFDHAGGLADFPEAKVHLHTKEFEYTQTSRISLLKRRLPTHWQHGPDWQTYEPTDGRDWFGFQCVRAMKGLTDDIRLIPLIGHSLGHSGVAVRTENGWLLHAGDAYFSHSEIRGGDAPWTLRLLQRVIREDRDSWKQNREQLSRLSQNEEVDIICSHDPGEFHSHCQSSGERKDS